MSKPRPESVDPENPEWTEQMFAKARPAREVLGTAFIERVRRPVGRPKADAPKAPVSIRLDADVVSHLRGKGPGWQTAVNDALARLIAAGKL